MSEDQARIDQTISSESLAMIRLFADGAFHSGEELGRLLGVSRAAVWKRLQQLQALLGLQFESVRGKGYRLLDPVELLNGEQIRESLPPDVSSWLECLEIHGLIDSTNRRVAQLAQRGAESGLVVVAEQQSAGSGRRGRRWVSPFGRNIYCSMLWTFEGGVSALEGLSLVVGVVVARVLAPLTRRDVQLKWPNDVLVERQKISGILLEVVGDLDGRCSVIIGIGVNVDMTGAKEVASIDQAWTDVASIADAPVSRNELLSALIWELVPALSTFERDGFGAFLDEWTLRDYLRGKVVVIESGGRSLEGIAIGLDSSGGLKLDIEGSVQVIHGGEVSVRPQS